MLKTASSSLERCIRETTYVFNTFDEIRFGIQIKRVNIPYIVTAKLTYFHDGIFLG